MHPTEENLEQTKIVGSVSTYLGNPKTKEALYIAIMNFLPNQIYDLDNNQRLEVNKLLQSFKYLRDPIYNEIMLLLNAKERIQKSILETINYIDSILLTECRLTWDNLQEKWLWQETIKKVLINAIWGIFQYRKTLSKEEIEKVGRLPEYRYTQNIYIEKSPIALALNIIQQHVWSEKSDLEWALLGISKLNDSDIAFSSFKKIGGEHKDWYTPGLLLMLYAYWVFDIEKYRDELKIYMLNLKDTFSKKIESYEATVTWMKEKYKEYKALDHYTGDSNISKNQGLGNSQDVDNKITTIDISLLRDLEASITHSQTILDIPIESLAEVLDKMKLWISPNVEVNLDDIKTRLLEENE
jgi:hypothetical protein